MAESIETTNTKVYPFKQEDISYEQEIVDAIKKLPLEQRFQAIALNNYTLMRKQVESETEGQIQELVKKYNKIQAPLLEQINQIVSGQRAPTQEEIQDAKTHLTPEEIEKINENLTAEAVEEYWLKILTNCVQLAGHIFTEDHDLLKKITSVEHHPEDDSDNFTITFKFAPNDYFDNEVLSVKFIMLQENEVARTEGTEIQWKEGKNFTIKTKTKKQKNKKTGKTRTVTQTVPADSFFNFFRTITPKEDEEEEEDEERANLEANYEIATIIQDEIVPFSLEYYLGVRRGDEEGDDDFEGIDEEDEDDEDDDDEEDSKPARKGKAAKGGAEGAPKQECKQQ